MHIYKVSEWQSAGGRWYCNDVEDLAGISGLWWVPARMLGISPANYVKMLIDTYSPDNISFNKNTLIFSWNKENYAKMHRYVLDINREARNRKFFV